MVPLVASCSQRFQKGQIRREDTVKGPAAVFVSSRFELSLVTKCSTIPMKNALPSTRVLHDRTDPVAFAGKLDPAQASCDRSA